MKGRIGMNLLKKSGAALAAALLLIGAQPAFAAPSLSEEEILMAKADANKKYYHIGNGNTRRI